jgi:hypothetical protein
VWVGFCVKRSNPGFLAPAVRVRPGRSGRKDSE